METSDITEQGVLPQLEAARWLVLLLAGTSSGLAQSWHDTTWHYRKKRTADHPKVGTVRSTDQSSFPVLVSLSADAGLSAHALGSGWDIFFTDSTGNTKIPCEPESYASGTLLAWGKVTTPGHTTDTVVRLYFGNSSASDQQDASRGVSDANYQAVWHMKEAPGLPAVQAPGHDWTETPTGSPTQTASQIGGSPNFTGTSHYEIGHRTSSSPFRYGGAIRCPFCANRPGGRGTLKEVNARRGRGYGGLNLSLTSLGLHGPPPMPDHNALTTTTGAVPNFGTGIIVGGTLTTPTVNGTIQTSLLKTTNSTPIPAGKTWGGNYEYD